MILDISDGKFRDIFGDERFQLPIRWDGQDFERTVRKLFDNYMTKVHAVYPKESLKELQKVCGYLTNAIQDYLNGFPAYAYYELCKAMKLLMETPLKRSYSSKIQQLKAQALGVYEEETPPLFRVTTVPDNKPYSRARIFHTPYDMRSKVSTSRYSIAGFPSLYLGTSLELCCEEIHLNPYQSYGLAGVFRLKNSLRKVGPEVEVLELSVKPQDFLEEQIGENDAPNEIRERRRGNHNGDPWLKGDRVREGYVLWYPAPNETIERRRGNHDGDPWLKEKRVQEAYVLWYPLIAACSYIRVNKADPFAAEYIIPQLLMQWVRSQMRENLQQGGGKLVGIRYFSCASVRASNMGLNYVFPTSGGWSSGKGSYCPVLTRAFQVSKPVYIHEFDSIADCEAHLKRVTDLKPMDA